ncbi:MlaD family protein [Iodidimonas sp. SYSU 1G8]|uniref:MlaD family protein n=1 Tax=Iodidimonas sp. SYSU 1G8 TaxID=3133967 RepID=UPI0031FE5F79
METRAHHVLIGSFVLMMFVGLIAFFFWAAKVDIDKDYNYYNIYFDTPVTGLGKAGEVRFNGLLVGEVRQIAVDPRKASRVKVTIRVFSNTPVTTDTIATLEVMGFTGVSFVQLINDDKDDKPGQPLSTPEGEEYPIIPSRITGLQGVFRTAPEVLASAIRVLDQANKLISDENIGKVSRILDNVETTSGGVAAMTPDLQATIAQARDTMERVNRVAANVETMTAQDVPAALADIRKAARNFEQVSDNLNQMIAENRGAVSNFTGTALPEIGQFATEARRAAASLNRVLERIEQSPTDFLFPPKTPQIEAPKP